MTTHYLKYAVFDFVDTECFQMWTFDDARDSRLIELCLRYRVR